MKRGPENSSAGEAAAQQRRAQWAWLFACCAMAGAAAAWATMPVAVPPMWCGFAVDWLCFFYFDWLLKSLLLLTLIRWVQKPLRRFITLQAASWTVGFLIIRLMFLWPIILPLTPLFPTPNEIAAASFFWASNEGRSGWSRGPDMSETLPPPERVAVSSAFISPLDAAAIVQTSLFWVGLTVAAAFSFVWLTGSLYHAASLFRSLRDARRLIQQATPVSQIQGADAIALQSQGARAAKALRCRRPFTVFLAPPGAITGPAMFGWFRPVILLPREALTWEQARQYASLLHEVAHIQRNDWPQLMATNLLLILFWFAPAVRNSETARRTTADMSCDVSLTQTHLDRVDYAAVLETTFEEAYHAKKSRLEIERERQETLPALVCMADVAVRGEGVQRVRFLLKEAGLQRRVWRGVSPVIGAALLLPILFLFVYTWTPSGAVTSQPLLIPVTRRANGDLTARRAGYWKQGNWVDTCILMQPNGRLSVVIGLTKSQIFWGCGIRTYYLLLDKERRVLFHGGSFARGMDGRLVDFDTIPYTSRVDFDERVPADSRQRIAYIAIINTEGSGSFLWRRMQERNPSFRNLPSTTTPGGFRLGKELEKADEARRKKMTPLERWAAGWLDWLSD